MNVGWTPASLSDLVRISDWLTEEASPEIALSILAKISDRANFLRNFPHGGRPHTGGLRILRVYNTPYLIRYRIVDDRAEVLRIHHEREDWHVGS